jgi:hypothetical protein
MQFTGARYRMVKDMAKGLCFTRKTEHMKESGSMMLEMVRAMRDTPITTNMKVSL